MAFMQRGHSSAIPYFAGRRHPCRRRIHVDPSWCDAAKLSVARPAAWGALGRFPEDAMVSLNVNGGRREAEVDPETPLLWVLRDHFGLRGAKYGCGIGQCGACTVLVDGVAQRSCVLPVEAVGDAAVTTIEAFQGRHRLQKAWLDQQVPQCGYCQAGQIMAAAALLAEKPKPSDAEIDEAMAGNLCRCGTYLRIRAAIRAAAGVAA
jgi:isoquinoline 1-oxidoreductase alpha subunit